ncbi:MAG TPA: UPF0182 family protein [Candidatus Dormibacteraeota bacterium]|jgi:uncharacterized membrane protein (UPF0182 family)
MKRGGRGDFFENIEPLFPRGRPPNFSNFAPSRGTRRLLYIAGVILLLVVLVRPVVGFYTDLLWFRSLDFEQLYLTRVQYQAWILLGGFLLAFLAIAASAGYAVRQVGFRSLSAIGVRRRFLTAAAGRLVLLGSALMALIMGTAAAGSWEALARALNAVAFNRTDPVFGQDISFYVFQMPLYRFAWGWLLGLLVVCTGSALFIYLSRGANTPQVLPPRALTHLSLLAAAFFLLLAVHYRLAMFELLLGKHGFVYGAGYTDVNVRLPMYWVMLVLSLVLALVALANAALRRLTLMAGALVVWLAAALVLLVLAPAVVQRVAVTPSELGQEKPYIQREIDATNTAYGLDGITVKDFPASQQPSAEILARNTGTVSNIRLWDYQPLQDAYNQIQTIRQYYDFNRVAIDRYHLSDGYHQLMMSARELSTGRLPDNVRTWVNIHLKYTHGYGAAATPVNKVANEGLPSLVLRDIPPQGEPAITRPQIYFGETTTDYVVAHSKETEVDYEKGDNQVYSSWQGSHGVQLSGGLRRLAYAYQLGDVNLLLSTQVTSDSQLLYRRSIQDRLQQLAPFLTFDQDPYLVISGGRMYWIIDGLTSSDSYPYSDPYVDGGANYLRNSVKAVIDAYEGTVSFYVADPGDPVISTYQHIFPGVFQPLDHMPADLRQHIRFPESLFNIQTQMLQTFHMHDPQAFYNRADSWSQPNEVTAQGAVAAPLQPYYVVMKLPGQDHEEFVLIQPFTPLNKKNMVAWVAARSDGADYGKLLEFRFPTDRQVTGPEQVESRVDQDPTISAQLSLLNQHGSKVVRGNLLVIPIEDSILFVEPVYLESTGNAAIPELKKVVVADEQHVLWADTLDQALQALTSGQPAPAGTTTTPPGTAAPGASQTVQQLVARAQQLYSDAQAKLRAGDLAGYASDINQLGALLDQIKAASGGAAASPSPSVRPSASP